MKFDDFAEELVLTAADLEFARTVYQQPGDFPHVSESEVAMMRERMERDRMAESRFIALRRERLASRRR